MQVLNLDEPFIWASFPYRQVYPGIHMTAHMATQRLLSNYLELPLFDRWLKSLSVEFYDWEALDEPIRHCA